MRPSLAVSRRRFLHSAAAVACAPYVVPAAVFGDAAPSNRINVGFIGNGNQSTVDLPAFMGHDDAQVLAVCDVNTASGGYRDDRKQFLGRKPTQEKVNAFYAKKKKAATYRGCDAYIDFREVLDRKDIDVVAIVVPDHWHGLMTVMAARAGKDIYCEKPLSLTIGQGQLMVKAVREHHRVLQTGSMYRSSPAVRFACELVLNGRIGKLQRIHTFLPPNNAVDPGPGWKPMPVPEGFDYERWLGPAPEAPYHERRCLYRFRFNLDYSGGQVTNFGAHTNDIAQWGMGTSQTGPIEVEDLGGEFPPVGSLYNTATKVNFRAKYASGVELICATNPDPHTFATQFEGTEGTVRYDYKGVHTTPESLKDTKISPNEIHLFAPVPGHTENNSKLFVPDHVRNFLDCVKSRKDPNAAVEIGHRTASLCHLGNIAMRLHRKLQWDPDQEHFVGDDQANALLNRPLREPWHF